MSINKSTLYCTFGDVVDVRLFKQFWLNRHCPSEEQRTFDLLTFLKVRASLLCGQILTIVSKN